MAFFDWQIASEPDTAEGNMAADAALLAALVEGRNSQPTLRVYEWDSPAVSIGRLQREEPVRRAYPSLPIVRRPTGGRAVLHGDDLTIAIALPLDCLPLGAHTSVLASHRALMGCVAAALRAVGLAVRYGPDACAGHAGSVRCFDTSAGCDLVDAATGRKLVGSAQRREGRALLQQMSLPLDLLPGKERFLSGLRSELEKAFT